MSIPPRRHLRSEMLIDPESLTGPDRYKLLIGGIVPRPVAWVSTVSPTLADGSVGRLNLAPFSFFNGVSSTPMLIMFCPANKPDGAEKDTLRNCKPLAEGGTGEFVINVVTEAHERQMARCAEPLPYGESEFEAFDLTPVASSKVRPPRVEGAPLAFECVTHQVLRFGQGVPGAGNMVIGRIVRVWAADGLVNERFHVDPAKLLTIGRMGGLEYCRTRERFEMPMGRGG